MEVAGGAPSNDPALPEPQFTSPQFEERRDPGHMSPAFLTCNGPIGQLSPGGRRNDGVQASQQALRLRTAGMQSPANVAAKLPLVW